MEFTGVVVAYAITHGASSRCASHGMARRENAEGASMSQKSYLVFYSVTTSINPINQPKGASLNEEVHRK
jgi:hypothetical protein